MDAALHEGSLHSFLSGPSALWMKVRGSARTEIDQKVLAAWQAVAYLAKAWLDKKKRPTPPPLNVSASGFEPCVKANNYRCESWRRLPKWIKLI